MTGVTTNRIATVDGVTPSLSTLTPRLIYMASDLKGIPKVDDGTAGNIYALLDSLSALFAGAPGGDAYIGYTVAPSSLAPGMVSTLVGQTATTFRPVFNSEDIASKHLAACDGAGFSCVWECRFNVGDIAYVDLLNSDKPWLLVGAATLTEKLQKETPAVPMQSTMTPLPPPPAPAPLVDATKSDAGLGVLATMVWLDQHCEKTEDGLPIVYALANHAFAPKTVLPRSGEKRVFSYASFEDCTASNVSNAALSVWKAVIPANCLHECRITDNIPPHPQQVTSAGLVLLERLTTPGGEVKRLEEAPATDEVTLYAYVNENKLLPIELDVELLVQDTTYTANGRVVALKGIVVADIKDGKLIMRNKE